MQHATADYTWLTRRAGAAPLVVAHRGASGLAPENTLAAFRLALDLGAPALECDVHLAADGAPVVIHDARLDRTTSGVGEVGAHTLADLRLLDAGAWFGAPFAGERLPTLPEVLAVAAGRARVFVELKAGGGASLVEAALRALAGAPDTPVAVISFDQDMVAEVARRRPDLALGFLVTAAHVALHGPARVIDAARTHGAGFFCPQHSAATPDLVAAARAAGLPVSVWTVDDPVAMQRLAAAGVDAITTNRPDLALAALGK